MFEDGALAEAGGTLAPDHEPDPSQAVGPPDGISPLRSRVVRLPLTRYSDDPVTPAQSRPETSQSYVQPPSGQQHRATVMPVAHHSSLP